MSSPEERDAAFEAAIDELLSGNRQKESVRELLELYPLDLEVAIPDVVEPTPKPTLVVNLFTGPGAGKTTVAHGLMNKLKWRKVRAEAALEYAKDLVWERRHDTFRDQIYLFGKMYHRIFRLLDQVSVVVTDSPILLTPIYDTHRRKPLAQLALDEHNKMWTYNVFLKRLKDYDPIGRNQNEAEAKVIDREVLDFLDVNQVPYEVFECYEGIESVIVYKIQQLIGL